MFIVLADSTEPRVALGLQIPHCEDDDGNDVDLFELTCTPSSETSTHQMSITIKESCRKSDFSGIDFAHSFIWGDQVRRFLLTRSCPQGPDC